MVGWLAATLGMYVEGVWVVLIATMAASGWPDRDDLREALAWPTLIFD